MADDTLTKVRQTLQPLTGAHDDYDALLALIGDAPIVLLGEASHGTHEFYRERARITQRLISEQGFAAVAVEADWPDAWRVNRYVRQLDNHDSSASEALADFERFPLWMWRNADVLDFVGWLRSFNEALPREQRVGFYGLDLYSLHSSIDSIIELLEKLDPPAAREARDRYACFDHFGDDTQAYGYATAFGISDSCRDEVIAQLIDLRNRAMRYIHRDGQAMEDAIFDMEQNARLVKNAEEYYRSMFRGRADSWNLRDQHMAETLDAILNYLERQGRPAKVVVWEHNSHLGDARATDMSKIGELNVGQLVRERYGRQAVLIGFTTYHGTVTATSNWDESAQYKRVRPALPNSYEALFHETGVARFYLPLRDSAALAGLREPRLERAIGVIYRPETERASHYFFTRLPDQFDVVLHFDETQAVKPLDKVASWRSDDVPETYPSSL